MLIIAFWRLLALFFVGLAFIGAILPGLPTTVFLLSAVWASSKGWPKLHDWLLRHPRFGPLISQWQTHRAVPRRAKWIAGLSMLASTFILLYSSAPLWVKCTAPTIMIVVMIWLASRPEMPTTCPLKAKTKIINPD
ncbi:hypothetical protein related to heme utilization [Nitrincola lacisaponensis]|uniref:Inner membrane protein n=1 Tax=Nitrincola lacisaponensis TaxID=267850 RepID=A0A063Y3F5_9GAMM|nr:YbaN family protein [Nitrincola lacisaponensis]KDE40843.1 hypothetical protein related to heme utilization [Nitrincola lacisaponensis]